MACGLKGFVFGTSRFALASRYDMSNEGTPAQLAQVKQTAEGVRVAQCVRAQGFCQVCACQEQGIRCRDVAVTRAQHLRR